MRADTPVSCSTRIGERRTQAGEVLADADGARQPTCTSPRNCGVEQVVGDRRGLLGRGRRAATASNRRRASSMAMRMALPPVWPRYFFAQIGCATASSGG